MHLLTLPTPLLTLLLPLITPALSIPQHTYSEHLHLTPLPPASLYAGFNFTSTTPLSSYLANNFRYFPRALAQILQYTHTSELHLRFALGRWDDENWGARPRDGGREGGNGVELWAWVEDDLEKGGKGAEERWGELVNSLSGLFCASLNFVDSGKTIKPVLSFDPEGMLEAGQLARGNVTGKGQGKLRLLQGMLPHEVVCTENLTPFLKLLPCKGKAGISTLLDGHKLFDANWQTMAVDVRPVCDEDGECEIEIQQTVDMVLDIERSMRPRESPIPRPPPVEDILCDEDKSYHGHDTCYPTPYPGETEWSISRIFGRPIRGSCPLSSNPDDFDLTLSVPADRNVEVIAEAAVPQHSPLNTQIRAYKLPEGKTFDLLLPQQPHAPTYVQNTSLTPPPLFVTRQITGYGAERGGMHTLIRNPLPYAQRIVYLESLPWFLRPYMHTLKLSGPGRMEKMFYTPLIDRKRGTQLELLLEVAGGSTVELTYDFEKTILRYTEYPPDANRGFDVPAAIVRVLPAEGEVGQGQYLRTTSLLLPLPTPDFSMPYNVIILTSTVIALGFGSIFNLLTRRFVLVEEVPVSPLAGIVGQVRERVGEVWGRIMGGGKGSAGEESGGGKDRREDALRGGDGEGRRKGADGKPDDRKGGKER
ncbi:Subunit of the glycosylphosphatidylinositol transamidase complex-like protein [Extremus antarcticus]|uniref:Subunit of the glycosylphosphatidylinositol transamidase complex-like protein n=1 Tax=Extremus antarcticus TaxID=702011 RepID=A0AAJ0DB16_9PEZI|nr:Subunit of the glycosylphosphatidylinositol transamidase complex-like protein [Extremus antarcticus]